MVGLSPMESIISNMDTKIQPVVRKLALNISENNCFFLSQIGIHKFRPLVLQDSRDSADTI